MMISDDHLATRKKANRNLNKWAVENYDETIEKPIVQGQNMENHFSSQEYP